MKKILFFNSVFLLTSLSFILPSMFAQQQSQSEQLTITTYYPSPHGSYNSLYVGKGGLRLGKPVENVQPNIWNNIETVSVDSAGLFVITVVPKDGGAVSSFMILFSADSSNMGMQLLGGPAISDLKNDIDQLINLTESAKFRTQLLKEHNSFTLQIMPVKECTVYIGKMLSYWLTAE
jgi:hypothetical protein